MFVTLALWGQHQKHILSFLFAVSETTLVLVKVLNLRLLWPLEKYSPISHVLVTPRAVDWLNGAL